MKFSFPLRFVASRESPGRIFGLVSRPSWMYFSITHFLVVCNLAGMLVFYWMLGVLEDYCDCEGGSTVSLVVIVSTDVSS